MESVVNLVASKQRLPDLFRGHFPTGTPIPNNPEPQEEVSLEVAAATH